MGVGTVTKDERRRVSLTRVARHRAEGSGACRMRVPQPSAGRPAMWGTLSEGIVPRRVLNAVAGLLKEIRLGRSADATLPSRRLSQADRPGTR